MRAFDLVVFMGVFYHLRYPLLGLDIAAQRTGRLMLFQTLSLPGEEIAQQIEDLSIEDRSPMLQEGWPKMAFIEHSLAGDRTNWWAANHAGIEAMLRSSGLRVVARPGQEVYLCEPDPEHPSCVSTWDAEEYLSATGKNGCGRGSMPSRVRDAAGTGRHGMISLNGKARFWSALTVRDRGRGHGTAGAACACGRRAEGRRITALGAFPALQILEGDWRVDRLESVHRWGLSHWGDTGNRARPKAFSEWLKQEGYDLLLDPSHAVNGIREEIWSAGGIILDTGGGLHERMLQMGVGGHRAIKGAIREGWGLPVPWNLLPELSLLPREHAFAGKLSEGPRSGT
jgi:hypothetical protein